MAVLDTSRDDSLPMNAREKPCNCGATAYFSRHCGAWVCGSCNVHIGLARCYCGWSSTSNDGRRELIEMGETIDDDY